MFSQPATPIWDGWEARTTIAHLHAIIPAMVPDVGYPRNLVQRELLLSGLRMAAGEVG